jgi:hypothetical protein
MLQRSHACLIIDRFMRTLHRVSYAAAPTLVVVIRLSTPRPIGTWTCSRSGTSFHEADIAVYEVDSHCVRRLASGVAGINDTSERGRSSADCPHLTLRAVLSDRGSHSSPDKQV